MHNKRWWGPQVLKTPWKSMHINTAWVFWCIRHGKRSPGQHVEFLNINSQQDPQDTLILTSDFPWAGPSGTHYVDIQWYKFGWQIGRSFSSSFDPCQIGTEDKLHTYPCSWGKWVFTAPQESAFERLSKLSWWDRITFIGKARRENSFSGSISKHFKAFWPPLFK